MIFNSGSDVVMTSYIIELEIGTIRQLGSTIFENQLNAFRKQFK